MAYYQGVIFDGIDITELDDIKITRVSTDAIPDVSLSDARLSRQDGQVIYSKNYGARKIIIEGHIATSGRDEYFTTRSRLLRNVDKRNKILQTPRSPQPTEFTATFSNIIFTEVGGGFAKFSIEFQCSDPFGYERDTIVLLDAVTNTDASNSLALYQVARGDVPSPAIITIQLTSATGTSSKYIKLSNEAGDYIQVTRDWSVDDTLEFDMLEKTVKVNGVLTDYSGTYWNLQIDEEFLNYEDDLDTRSVDITVTYRPRVL